MSNLAIARIQKEVTMLQRDPPPGAWAGPIEGKPLTELEAGLQGPPGTVYEQGVFKLSIHIPTRYPMEPPKIRFVTPVYHPNIDAEGRICLDLLNPPPKGAWKPSLNIGTLLTSIALLLSEPNPDDGLVTDTTYEYKHRREVYDAAARAWTRQHAMQNSGEGAGPVGADAAGPSGAKPEADDVEGVDAKSGEIRAEEGRSGEGEEDAAGDSGKENGGGSGSAEGKAAKEQKKEQLAKPARSPLSGPQDAPEAKRAKLSPPPPLQDL